MKRYEIQTLNGEVVLSLRATDKHDFHSALCSVRSAGDDLLGRYFVGGKEMSLDDAFSTVCADIQAAFDKKCETHKLIYVHNGASSCSNTYTAKWVKK